MFGLGPIRVFMRCLCRRAFFPIEILSGGDHLGSLKMKPLKTDVSMMSVENSEDSPDPISQGLLPALVVVCVAMLALSLWTSVADPASRATSELIDSLHECAANVEQSARLSCYDKALAAAHPARGANAPVLLHQRP
jgi:hypothetical protein